MVHGPRDHRLLHLEELDEAGKGITARTRNLASLHAAAGDARLDFVELCDGPQQRRHLGQVKLVKLADLGLGRFKAVHFNESLWAFGRQIDGTRSNKPG